MGWLRTKFSNVGNAVRSNIRNALRSDSTPDGGSTTVARLLRRKRSGEGEQQQQRKEKEVEQPPSELEVMADFVRDFTTCGWVRATN